MGRISNAEYQRRQDNRNAGLGFLLLVLLAIGVFLIMPGMAILTAVVEVFTLSLEPRQMWVISFVISVVVFLFMRWRAFSFREAGKAYMSLSGIIALLFVLLHFGLQTTFAARWTARFVPEAGAAAVATKEQAPPRSPARPSVARVEAQAPLAALQSPEAQPQRQNSPPPSAGPVPVRRAVAVTDEEPPFAALPLPPAAATTPPPAGAPAKFAIVGIAPQDMLNVRAGPGANFPKIHELRPGYDKITAVSPPQLNGDTEWVLITFENYSGWVARQFICAAE